jgi:predicted RNA binding protein YcfA (HicA-like mRNA interferase family)
MAVHYLTRPRFDAGENLLQGQVKEGVIAPNQPAWHWEAATHLTRSMFNYKSDIWLVIPKGATPRLPVGALPKTCSSRDLIGLYKKAGWTEDVSGGKGSHTKLRKVGQRSMTVPLQRDLRPGFLNDALKKLGPYRLNDLPRLLDGSIQLPV